MSGFQITNQTCKVNSSKKSVTVSKVYDLFESHPITVPVLYNSEDVHAPVIAVKNKSGYLKKLTLLHIKSLEPSLPSGVSSFLKSKDSIFATGWVYDSVIDAFLLHLSEAQPHVLFTDTCIPLLLMSDSACDRLWSNHDLSKKSMLLFPANLSGNHWFLVVVEIKTRKISYLNPSGQDPGPSESRLMWLIINLICKRFQVQSDGWNWRSPPRTVQKDAINCGTFVMWYAYQMANNKSITDDIDVIAFRHTVFKILVGNCMRRTSFSIINCQVCRGTDVNDNVISCSRCFQLFHCKCLGLSHSSIDRDKFVCP